MIVRRCLGVFLDGSYLRLALVARRINRYEVLALLTIQDYLDKPNPELRAALASFLSKNNAGNFRCVLTIPRHDLIIRRIELPKAAEANLLFVDSGEVLGTSHGAYTQKDVEKLKKKWEKRVSPMFMDTLFSPSPNQWCKYCIFRTGGPTGGCTY